MVLPHHGFSPHSTPLYMIMNVLCNHNQTQFGTITVIANSTDVNEYMNTFFVFPNPVTTQITVNKGGIKNIYNQLGELLISSRKTIDITHLKVGIYILQCEQIQKIIKQ